MISEPRSSRAILIGTYAYSALEDLPAVRNNVERLGDLLIDEKVWGLPQEHCTRILQPTNAADLVDVVKEIAAEATDTLVFYYAGHGLTAPRSLELCLTLRGSRVNEEHTTLPYNWLRQAILASGALRKVVILDCCYSARAMIGGMSATSEIVQEAEIEGTYLFAAAAETKKALAPPGENYTAFTGEIINVIQEGVAGAGSTLSMDVIYENVHAALARKSRPLPQQRNRNTAGRIAFVHNLARLIDEDAAAGASQADSAFAESSLAHALRHRAESTGDGALLDEAIRLYRKVVTATVADPQHPGYARNLANLGDTLRVRAETMSERRSLDESIETLRAATAAAPTGHPDRVFCLTALGNALRLRAQETSDSASLREATDILRAAVDAAPPGMPSRAQAMQSLGETLWGIAQLKDDRASADTAIEAWRTAAMTTGARTRLRVDAARRWGEAIAERDGPSAGREAFSLAVSLLPTLASWQIDLLDQEQQLAGYLGLASDAAACHLAAGDPESALRMLELGRGVLLNRIMDISSDHSPLHGVAPKLAQEFDALRTVLAGEPLDTEGDSLTEISGLASDRRHSAANRLDELITEIRSLPGYSGFFLPPTLTELQKSAVDGPVITVNISRYRSDAIILTADEVSMLPLPTLNPDTVRQRTSGFLRAVSMTGRFEDRVSAQLELRATLSWLWTDIVQPIMERLGLREQPDKHTAWPRIFWCPTGLLSLLPLHAAGVHDERASDSESPFRAGARRNLSPDEGHGWAASLLDLAVSSYTTTLRSLRESQSRPATMRSAGKDRFLVASLTYMGYAPQAEPIPGAGEEARQVLRLFPHARHVSDLEATRLAIKHELSATDWAHFACHSITDPEHPINSGLVLADGTLAARDIVRMRYERQPQFVFLSGCGTAQGGMRLADEAVHVASAFQASGFRHVIGTLWPIDDEGAARYAANFYSILLGGANDPALAAHMTTRQLREHYPDAPRVWAAVIHLGPSRNGLGGAEARMAAVPEGRSAMFTTAEPAGAPF